ncbi:hypothetical protein ACH5RR_010202 [Cinchona calisaya]|uniref:PRISE-like Rossmann-fold domain-containing protein n=1 Tax=Cinchona calisaya TaxID=153742 RepID=A0ABD3AIF0_9GENT
MAIKGSKKIECAPVRYVAAIFGVTGLVGKELARRLLSSSKCQWKVYGIARAPQIKETIQNPNYHFISCNLQNPSETRQKLSSLGDVTHVFWVTWASQFRLDSAECCEENKVMMSNVLNAILARAKELKHVSLQTGTKHYISLQEPFNAREVRYYDEQCPRASTGHNFYYVLEDLLHERLDGKIPWSIHRPGFILGCSHRTLYNLIGSLCVYGMICKKLKLPFVFGGTRECWEEMCIDASDARLVAEQHIWAATTETIQSPHGQAFNAINGSGFTWKETWPAIGMKFGLVGFESDNMMFCQDFMFSTTMADKGGIWKEIVMQEGLVQTEMNDLANWEFLDILFRFPRKMLGTRNKVDGLGFTMRFQTLDSILFWIDVMREEKLIP